MMQISFVRTQGQPDRVYVRRSDGAETSWPFPSYGDGLPHDLVHLVVEAGFGVRRGFWSRVDEGVDVVHVNAHANRVGGRDKYAGLGADRGGLLVAEALAGLHWHLVEVTDPERRDAAAHACRELGVALPPSVTVEAIAAVREVLGGLQARWRALVPKGTLRVGFDPADPAAGFAGLRAAAGL